MKKSRDFSRNIHSRDWYLKRGIYVGVGLDMGESGEGVPMYHSRRVSPHSDLGGIDRPRICLLHNTSLLLFTFRVIL